MKTIIRLTVTISLALTFIIGQARQGLPEDSRYPNELPLLKLYSEAKWKSIVPYVSTEQDVEKVLGKPVLIHEEDSATQVFGYDYDPDWTIVVSYVGDPVDSIVGRVAEITLRPKRRVSMIGVSFPPAFHRGQLIDSGRNAHLIAYQDKLGLRYSVYAKDGADGRSQAGDLDSVSYGPSDADEARHKNPPQSRAK